MGEVKSQGHIIHPVSNRCTFSFHINRTNYSWDMSNRVFDLEKTHPKFSKKILQKKRVSNRMPLKSNQVIGMTSGISLPSFVVIGWVVLTFSCRQANLCLSMPQPWPWVKVTKGHPVHFPRPILCLSQICKVQLKRFWREKQKLLQRWWTRMRTRTRTGTQKGTENINIHWLG